MKQIFTSFRKCRALRNILFMQHSTTNIMSYVTNTVATNTVALEHRKATNTVALEHRGARTP